MYSRKAFLVHLYVRKAEIEKFIIFYYLKGDLPSKHKPPFHPPKLTTKSFAFSKETPEKILIYLVTKYIVRRYI